MGCVDCKFTGKVPLNSFQATTCKCMNGDASTSDGLTPKGRARLYGRAIRYAKMRAYFALGKAGLAALVIALIWFLLPPARFVSFALVVPTLYFLLRATISLYRATDLRREYTEQAADTQ